MRALWRLARPLLPLFAALAGAGLPLLLVTFFLPPGESLFPAAAFRASEASLMGLSERDLEPVLERYGIVCPPRRPDARDVPCRSAPGSEPAYSVVLRVSDGRIRALAASVEYRSVPDAALPDLAGRLFEDLLFAGQRPVPGDPDFVRHWLRERVDGGAMYYQGALFQIAADRRSRLLQAVAYW